MKALIFFLCLVYPLLGSSQTNKEEFYKILNGKDSLVDYVLAHKDKFRLQFIVTDIQRDSCGAQSFYTYDFSNNSYFYPASLVKLPTSIFALEFLDSLKIKRDAVLKMNHDFECGSMKFVDLSQKNNLKFSDILEDMITVSNNSYYTLLFHMLTPKYLNYKLKKRNINSTLIYNSFSRCELETDIYTNSYNILSPDWDTLFSKASSSLDSIDYYRYYSYSKDYLIGKYILKNGMKIEEPLDFNYNLTYPLLDIHNTLFKLVFPSEFNSIDHFQITKDSRNFLLKILGSYPEEIENKKFHDIDKYPPNYYKFSIIGEDNSLANSGRYRIFSKIGIAYGFVTETAYIVDFEKQKDFIFSVSIYVNKDEIQNDGIYEYETIARPFISKLSHLIENQLTLKNNEKNNCNEYFKMINDIILN